MEQKSIILMLADKGVTPEQLGDELLSALVYLKDTKDRRSLGL